MRYQIYHKNGDLQHRPTWGADAQQLLQNVGESLDYHRCACDDHREVAAAMPEHWLPTQGKRNCANSSAASRMPGDVRHRAFDNAGD
jgi:hypothetical protein